MAMTSMNRCASCTLTFLFGISNCWQQKKSKMQNVNLIF